MGERGGHQCGVGTADRHFGKRDVSALESPPRARNDVAAIDLDLGAERRERHDQEIDGTRSDRAAARHGHLGLTHARHQRCNHPEACPHAGDQLIRRGGIDDVGGRDMQRLAVVLGFAGTLAAHHDVDAVVAQDALKESHIGKPRHVIENERLVGEKARDHQGQCGVFRARDRDRAVEASSAGDTNTIHVPPCPVLERYCDLLEPRHPCGKGESARKVTA